MKMNSKDWMKLVVSLIICFGTAKLSGFVASFGSRDWYNSLVQPAWSPPTIFFPIVWMIIFLLMTFSLWLVWKKGAKRSTYWVFGIQLGLNFLWMPLFFGLECLFCGLLFSAFLWIAVWANIIVFSRTSRTAAWLLVPYLIWVTFALALTINIYYLNVGA
jgi:translocator protein